MIPYLDLCLWYIHIDVLLEDAQLKVESKAIRFDKVGTGNTNARMKVKLVSEAMQYLALLHSWSLCYLYISVFIK